MIHVAVSAVTDFVALGERWRELEARGNGSFFQGWTWTGCLAETRFPRPILVEAREGDRTVALALFNRQPRLGRGAVLYLGESGDPALDNLAIEYNGVLIESGAGTTVETACLAAAQQAAAGRFGMMGHIVASGVGERTLAALRSVMSSVHLRDTRPAPFVDLQQMRAEGAGYLALRSANTRQQIRRSVRAYAEDGPIIVRRAEDVSEGLAFLEEMIPLHQSTWTTRGQKGSFASPFFTRFHRALIERGLPRGEIDLLRVSAGPRLIGILYNFRYRGRSLAYQSGFDYRTADHHQKPGITCHYQGILYSMECGLDCYDFLAGDHRYKRSLADAEQRLHWVEGTRRLPVVTSTIRRVMSKVARSTPT